MGGPESAVLLWPRMFRTTGEEEAVLEATRVGTKLAREGISRPLESLKRDREELFSR